MSDWYECTKLCNHEKCNLANKVVVNTGSRRLYNLLILSAFIIQFSVLWLSVNSVKLPNQYTLLIIVWLGLQEIS